MKSGPRKVFRYSSRYEKALPDGSFRCRMELHRASHARPQGIWTPQDSHSLREMVSVGAGQAYCHHHDPARAEERRRAASRAGKSKPSRELLGIKAQLEKLTEEVLSGEVATGVAAVANQLINTRLRAVELERRVKETEEL